MEPIKGSVIMCCLSMMVVVMKSLSQDIEESQRKYALKHFPMPMVQEDEKGVLRLSANF